MTDNVHGDDDTPEGHEDMADEHMNDTWDANVVQANGINLKRIVDDYANLAAQQAQSAQKQTDALWQQQLRFTEQWQQIAQQAAMNLTEHSQRTAANAASWDNLVLAGEVDTTAQGKMAHDLARSVAAEAVQAALAQTALTSPPSQGTTGVAQGAMQMGGGVATAAILAQIAKLAEAVNILYIKVLGEEATAEKPV
jgi:hypothetical protein